MASEQENQQNQQNQKDAVSEAEMELKSTGKVTFDNPVEALAQKNGSYNIEVNKEELLIAATLMQDAKYLRNLTFKKDPDSVRSYNLFHHFGIRWTLYFFILVILSLAIFERPAVVKAPYWATMIVELLCLGFFLFRFVHSAKFQTATIFWKDKKNLVILLLIVLTFIDMLCYVIWINVVGSNASPHPFRWSRPLRPLYIVNFGEGKEIRRAFRNIRRTLPGIVNVLILFFFSVLLFGLLGLKLLQNRKLTYPDGSPYFSTYFDVIWDLYVLVTTANNPDVMMPAYDRSNWYALYFMAYLIICLYIFMSILLAVIYSNYKKNLKNEVKSAVYMKRRKLAEAFDHVKVAIGTNFVITKQTWLELMKILYPNKSEQHADILLHVLDEKGDGCISKREFLNVADLLNVELSEVRDRTTVIEHFLPSLYNSRASKILKTCVRHKFFRYFFDLLIVANAFFIGFSLDQAEWFFLVFFTLEIVLKMYTYGGWRFFHVFWNLFDFLVIGAALIASIVEASMGDFAGVPQTLDVLLVLRVMRLVRILGTFNRFKIIIQTIVNIGPSILTYGGVIFVFYYTFAIIGMESFQGLIKYHGYNTTNASLLFCGASKLNGSEFYHERYCNNNFNDIMKSFVVLFELTVVNQWHILTKGFVLVTHEAAKIYFFSFHLMCVVIILNIFTAFILEAFILEFSLSQGKFETVVERKIKELGYGLGQKTGPPKNAQSDQHDLVENMESQTDDMSPAVSEESLADMSNEQGLRFHLKKKASKKVEVLLQHMFEDEIDPEDMGPEDLNQTIPEFRKRRLTLDLVT